jgi:hypothetical protein
VNHPCASIPCSRQPGNGNCFAHEYLRVSSITLADRNCLDGPAHAPSRRQRHGLLRRRRGRRSWPRRRPGSTARWRPSENWCPATAVAAATARRSSPTLRQNPGSTATDRRQAMAARRFRRSSTSATTSLARRSALL